MFPWKPPAGSQKIAEKRHFAPFLCDFRGEERKKMTWEFSVLDSLQTIHTPLLDNIMTFFTRFGDKGIFTIILCIVLLIIPRTRRIGLCVTVAALLDFLVINVILKNLISRIRPFDVNTAVDLLVVRPDDYSFPSGHSGVMFAAVGALFATVEKKWWIPVLVLGLIVVFSRLYLYVHYPTDVIAGMIAGFICGIAGAKIGNRIWDKITKNNEQE